MIHKTWLIVFPVLLFALVGVMVITNKAQGAKEYQALSGSGFTYQGQLKQNGAPTNASCNFRFSLWTESSNGSQVGDVQLVMDVEVSDGYFSIPSLDFGTNAFNGEARWLGIEVKCTGETTFTALSPRQTITPAPYALALPGLYTQQNEVSPNVIGGYHGNLVTAGVHGAVIGGGGANSSLNQVTDHYGTVVGGSGNQAGDGDEAFDNSQFASVIGGENNHAQAQNATIGGGKNNTAHGDYSTITGGLDAETTLFGQTSTASGSFSESGDAQASAYILRNVTANATATELFLDGASQRLTLPASRTMAFEIYIAGRRDAYSQSAGYLFRGVIKNDDGVTAFASSTDKFILGEDNPSWDANITASDTYEALIIEVSGAENANIRWVATVHTVEVAW